MQLTYELEAPSKDKYTLKVWGYNEYLVPTTFLSDYEYVHNCIKLEEDVVLILIPDSKVDRSFARTVSLFIVCIICLLIFLMISCKMITGMRILSLRIWRQMSLIRTFHMTVLKYYWVRKGLFLIFNVFSR